MPTIFQPSDLPVVNENQSAITTLANQAMLGTDALQVERILLEANAKSRTYDAADAERFLYVIRGRGRANIGEEAFPLETESVLWLEKHDVFTLEADGSEMEVLLCQAPAME
jgi:quercetin dioxygenase-like cupin family protein